MNRRQFLQLSALLAMGSAMGGCADLTSRYRRAEPLTRPEDYLLLTGCTVIDVIHGRTLANHASRR